MHTVELIQDDCFKQKCQMVVVKFVSLFSAGAQTLFFDLKIYVNVKSSLRMTTVDMYLSPYITGLLFFSLTHFSLSFAREDLIDLLKKTAFLISLWLAYCGSCCRSNFFSSEVKCGTF